MFRANILVMIMGLLFVCYSVQSSEVISESKQMKESQLDDHRKLVSMPEQARQLIRIDMLDHIAALNEIVAHLASNNLNAAAEVAEKRMGKSSMGKHRATGMGPGRFMTSEMRAIGWGMHESASEFARIAKQGDQKKAYSALQKITSACVACHYTYRTR